MQIQAWVQEHCKQGSILPRHSLGALPQPPDLSAPRYRAEVGIQESKGLAIQADKVIYSRLGGAKGLGGRIPTVPVCSGQMSFLGCGNFQR